MRSVPCRSDKSPAKNEPLASRARPIIHAYWIIVSPNTRTSIFVLEAIERFIGRQTTGSFSLNEVFSTIGSR